MPDHETAFKNLCSRLTASTQVISCQGIRDFEVAARISGDCKAAAERVADRQRDKPEASSHQRAEVLVGQSLPAVLPSMMPLRPQSNVAAIDRTSCRVGLAVFDATPRKNLLIGWHAMPCRRWATSALEEWSFQRLRARGSVELEHDFY